MSETLEPQRARPRRARAGLLRQRRVRVGAVVAVAGAVGFILWLVVGRSGGGGTPALKGQNLPVPISLSGLQTLARAVPTPFYWAGPEPGFAYELTTTSSGRVFIRYLPRGVEIGAKKPYLTIATYPVSNAFAATRRASQQPGAVRIDVRAGAIAFYNNSRPQSVYYAQSDSNYQVEIYDPSPARARRVVAAGEVKAVAGGPQTSKPNAKSVSAKSLRALAAALGHPLYWLGAKPGYTYELTRTATGRVFIRYLPPGVKVGADRPYLTVATYPFPGAFRALRAAAKGKGAVTIKLAGGGLAVVDAQYPKSLHLAFPGVEYQVEVFDPSPARARQVVASGEVEPVD